MHKGAEFLDEPCRNRQRVHGKTTEKICTKVKGHKDLDHAAIGLTGKVYATWKAKRLPQ